MGTTSSKSDLTVVEEGKKRLSIRKTAKRALMGAKHTKHRLRSEDIDYLVQNTAFSREEVDQWYENFMRDCPDGVLTRDQFLQIYETLYPETDSTKICEHVFRAFDKDDNKKVDFKEFIMSLNVLSNGGPEEKLNFAFTIYDLDHSDTVDRSEMNEMIQCLLALPTVERPANMAKLTAEEVATRLFTKIDVDQDNSITRSEFVSASLKDPELVQFLTSFYI